VKRISCTRAQLVLIFLIAQNQILLVYLIESSGLYGGGYGRHRVCLWKSYLCRPHVCLNVKTQTWEPSCSSISSQGSISTKLARFWEFLDNLLAS
jgi:hypothetical protein